MWYVQLDDMGPYRAAAAELQETFILSKTFNTMCFPCPIASRMFEGPLECTLLQAICLYIRWPWTTHSCVKMEGPRLKTHDSRKGWAVTSSGGCKHGCPPCEGELWRSDPKGERWMDGEEDVSVSVLEE